MPSIFGPTFGKQIYVCVIFAGFQIATGYRRKRAVGDSSQSGQYALTIIPLKQLANKSFEFFLNDFC